MLDQVSKYYIKASMTVGESFNLIKNILNIYYIENPGASFGILADRRWVFMLFSSIALVFMLGAILYMNRQKYKRYNRLPSIALALMFGGGIGNMIDRFFNYGVEGGRYEGINVVVDFLEFDFINFAVFNLADTFICIGSVLFCVSGLLGRYKFNDKISAKDETADIIKEFLEDYEKYDD